MSQHSTRKDSREYQPLRNHASRKDRARRYANASRKDDGLNLQALRAELTGKDV